MPHTRTEILNFLRENKQLFSEKFCVEKIGLFGSYALEKQTEQSDIDILIEMPRGTEDIFEKKNELRTLIEKEFGKNVDLCRERALNHRIKPYILKNVIYV